MQDVAKLANVSLATVSFTINNSKPVSEKTRAKVEKAMQDLDYRRNAIGSALAKGRTHVLALLYPALMHGFSPTGVQFFLSAAAQAQRRGYNLVLWPMDNDAKAVTELTTSGLVDGVILMEVQLDDPRVAELSRGTVPFSLIGRTRDNEGISFVDVDFEATIESAVARLTAWGHTNIAMIDRGPGAKVAGYGPTIRTRKAFSAATSHSGLTGSIMGGARTPDDGRSLAREFVAHHAEATGVLLMNEQAGPGFVAELKNLGYEIPRDLSIISTASSLDIAKMAEPELTVLISPSDELGTMGVDAVIERIDEREKPFQQRLVSCAFSPGGTLGPAPSGDRPGVL